MYLITATIIRGCLLPLGLVLGEGSPTTPFQTETQLSYDRTTFTLKDGLPSTMIRGLAVAQDGALWLGTSEGLARYDGDAFKLFPASSTPGVTSDRVLSMHVDRSGTLWTGVESAGAYWLNDGRFSGLGESHAFRDVKQFYESGDGTLWLAGLELSAYREGSFHHFTVEGAGQAPAVVHRIAEDSRGVLWAASDLGLLKLEGNRLSVLRAEPCTWVLRDFDGLVWARFRDGTVTPTEESATPPFSVDTVSIHSEFDLDGRRRLLATSDGLVLLSNGPGRLSPLSFLPVDEGGKVSALVSAGGDGIWSGTLREGLEHLRPQYVRPFPIDPKRPDLEVAHVFPDGMGGAIACDIKGSVNVQVSKGGEITHLSVPHGSGPGAHRITGVALVQGQRLVSTADGLTRQDGDRLVAIPGFEDRLQTIFSGPEQGAWLHQKDGQMLELLDATGRTGRSVNIGEFSGRFSAYGNALLFASGSQVRCFDTGSLEVSVLAELPGVVIRHMAEGRDRAIWISTYGHGLYRRLPDGTLHQWSLAEGLPNAYLGWIRAPGADGRLLVNSNSGVIDLIVDRLNEQASGKSTQIEARLFPAPEGNGDMGAELGDDTLALPTVRGLMLFDPAATPPPPPPPKVVIRSVTAEGMPLQPGTPLVGQTVLEFEFSALAFPSAMNATYEYRLVGEHQDWVLSDSSGHVRYGNVLPGDYVFEVRARTSDRPWSAPVQSAPILVVPHWYQRTSIRWIAAILGVLAVRGLISMRTRTAVGQAVALKAEVDRRITTESQLRTSEQRFRRLFDTAPSAIVAWDAMGCVIDFNDRALRLFGWTPASAKSETFEDQFESIDLARAAFDRVSRGTKELTILASLKPGKQGTRTCRWHFAPIFNGGEHGDLQMVMTVVTDLTSAERAARDIERLRERVAKAEESERSRIARELHDDLSQRLAALAIDAHMASQSAESNQPIESATLRQFQQQAESIAEDVHALSRKLHPTIVDDLGLYRALRSETQRRKQHTGVQIELRVDPNLEEPSKKSALALFRIAQEAMQNAWKHGGASVIDVVVEVEHDHHILRVADNGGGFDPDGIDVRQGGIGLASMRERARLVGGTLEVDSVQHAGTSITARIPVSVSEGETGDSI